MTNSTKISLGKDKNGNDVYVGNRVYWDGGIQPERADSGVVLRQDYTFYTDGIMVEWDSDHQGQFISLSSVVLESPSDSAEFTDGDQKELDRLTAKKQQVTDSAREKGSELLFSLYEKAKTHTLSTYVADNIDEIYATIKAYNKATNRNSNHA